MYRRRLAAQDVATVRFDPVNGPLEPVPTAALKPLDEVEAIRVAALLARAPRPRLKPDDLAAPPGVIPANYQSQSQSAPVPLLKPYATVRLAAEQPVPERKPRPAS
jgi:hypothetical protein